MSSDDFGGDTVDITNTTPSAPDGTDMSLDEWLDGATPFTREFTIYLDGVTYGKWLDALNEFNDLDRQRRMRDNDDYQVDETPLGEKGLDGLAQDKADELAALMDKLEQSKRVITMASLQADEDERIGRMPDGRGKMMARIAGSVVAPKYTPVQWEKIRSRLGESQWKGVLNAWAEVNSTDTINVDFSLPPSATRGTERS